MFKKGMSKNMLDSNFISNATFLKHSCKHKDGMQKSNLRKNEFMN